MDVWHLPLLNTTVFFDSIACFFFSLTASELEEASPRVRILILLRNISANLRYSEQELSAQKKKIRIVFDVTAREELEVMEGILVEKNAYRIWRRWDDEEDSESD